MVSLNKKTLKRAAERAGLRVVGDFLVALHNEDVISGLALDAPPSAIYIWAFVLPAFDALSFLHMSLGQRVVTCSADVGCLNHAIDQYNLSFSYIKSANQLGEYININNITNEYAIWTKYLCLIRARRFVEAENNCRNISESIKSALLRERLATILGVQKSEGWEAVYQLLFKWSAVTDELLPNSY